MTFCCRTVFDTLFPGNFWKRTACSPRNCHQPHSSIVSRMPLISGADCPMVPIPRDLLSMAGLGLCLATQRDDAAIYCLPPIHVDLRFSPRKFTNIFVYSYSNHNGDTLSRACATSTASGRQPCANCPQIGRRTGGS